MIIHGIGEVGCANGAGGVRKNVCRPTLRRLKYRICPAPILTFSSPVCWSMNLEVSPSAIWFASLIRLIQSTKAVVHK